MKIYENPQIDVRSMLNTTRSQKIVADSFKLQKLIFLGRQNIRLRGHRDEGPYQIIVGERVVPWDICSKK